MGGLRSMQTLTWQWDQAGLRVFPKAKTWSWRNLMCFVLCKNLEKQELHHEIQLIEYFTMLFAQISCKSCYTKEKDSQHIYHEDKIGWNIETFYDKKLNRNNKWAFLILDKRLHSKELRFKTRSLSWHINSVLT